MVRELSRQDFLRIVGGGAAGAALLGVYGCGGGEGTGTQESGEEITLTWWDYWTEGATNTAIKERLESYSESQAGVNVKRRNIPFDQLKPTLTRAASAGDLPDATIIDNPDHASFAELGVLMDITDRVEEWGKADAYFDGPWKSCQYEGKTYGIPNSSNCLALFYNKDVLDKVGVQPPTTWDELRENTEKLTTEDRFGLAVSAIKSEEGTFQWLPFLWQAGADIPNLASEAGQSAMQLWVDFVNAGWMSPGVLNWRQEDVKNEFVNGRAAMMINGPWQIPGLKEEYADLNWDVSVLPEGKESASILGGENMAITAQSENLDAAWELLKWTQEPDNLIPYLQKVGRLPSRKDLADEPAWADDPILSVFVEQLFVARPRAYGPNYPEISTYIQEAIQASISGESDVAAALSRAQEKITPLLPESMQ